MKSSGEALLALVDDMLDFTKIEAGRLDLHPEPTEVEALLQEIAELLAARAYAKGIDIAVDVAPSRAAAHPRRPEPAPPGAPQPRRQRRQVHRGRRRHALRVAPRGAGRPRIVFAVADSGPGVAPEEAERIFGEFEQIDSALARRHGGTGLGLAISRRIVRGMGGDITLEPGAAGGAVFSFALDLVGAEAVAGARPDACATDASSSSRRMERSRRRWRGCWSRPAPSARRHRHAGRGSRRSPARRPRPRCPTKRCSSTSACSPMPARAAAAPRGRRRAHPCRRADRAGAPRRDRAHAGDRLRCLSRPPGPALLAASHRRGGNRRNRRLSGRSRRCKAAARRGAGDAPRRASRCSSPRTTDQRAPRSRRPRAPRPHGHRGARRSGGGGRRHGGRRPLRRDPPRPAHARPRRARRGARDSRLRAADAEPRARRSWRSPPTCLPKRRSAAADAGIDAVLEKPVAPEALRRALLALTAA